VRAQERANAKSGFAGQAAQRSSDAASASPGYTQASADESQELKPVKTGELVVASIVIPAKAGIQA